MICTKCGKELPEGVRFCGYCGAPVETAESTPDTIVLEPVAEEQETAERTITEETVVEETAETPAEETAAEPEEVEEAEEAATETAEPEAEEEAVAEQESVTEEEPENTEEPVKEEEVIELKLPEEETAEPELTEVIETPAAIIEAEVTSEEIAEPVPLEPKKPNFFVTAAKKSYTRVRENVHKEDFLPLLVNLRHPSESGTFTVHATFTVCALTLIFNCIVFHNFLRGLLVLAVLMLTGIIAQLVNREEKFSIGRAIKSTAEVMEVPMILMFAAALFSASEKDHIQYMVCIIAAASQYLISCTSAAGKARHNYLFTAIMAAGLAVAAFVSGLM